MRAHLKETFIRDRNYSTCWISGNYDTGAGKRSSFHSFCILSNTDICFNRSLFSNFIHNILRLQMACLLVLVWHLWFHPSLLQVARNVGQLRRNAWLGFYSRKTQDCGLCVYFADILNSSRDNLMRTVMNCNTSRTENDHNRLANEKSSDCRMKYGKSMGVFRLQRKRRIINKTFPHDVEMWQVYKQLGYIQ